MPDTGGNDMPGSGASGAPSGRSGGVCVALGVLTEGRASVGGRGGGALRVGVGVGVRVRVREGSGVGEGLGAGCCGGTA